MQQKFEWSTQKPPSSILPFLPFLPEQTTSLCPYNTSDFKSSSVWKCLCRLKSLSVSSFHTEEAPSVIRSTSHKSGLRVVVSLQYSTPGKLVLTNQGQTSVTSRPPPIGPSTGPTDPNLTVPILETPNEPVITGNTLQGFQGLRAGGADTKDLTTRLVNHTAGCSYNSGAEL